MPPWPLTPRSKATDAGQPLGMAAFFETQQIAAMGAAVDESVDLAGIVAGDDDRGLADGRRDPVARLRDCRREAQKAPGRTLEDPLDFAPVLRGIGIEPERDLAQTVRRPGDGLLRRGAETGHAALLGRDATGRS
jgi:hypothetical protein